MRRALLLTALIAFACRSEPPPDKPSAPTPAVPAKSDDPAGNLQAPAPVERPPANGPPPTRNPDAPRIVAIGDVHGDLAAARSALQLAGAIDDSDAWVGGTLVVVQTGDQLDRGDDEPEILALLDKITAEAAAAGGAVHVLNGNHEIMNVAGDLRYVTEEGFVDFVKVPGLNLQDAKLQKIPAPLRSRAAAFLPGAPYGRMLSARNTIVMVGPNVFVHGGVLPAHVDYGIEKINAQVQEWMRGDSKDPSAVIEMIMAQDSPVWTRVYSNGPTPACDALADALSKLGAKRMVVGHTVQEKGITSACDDQVWRVDVGMAKFYGGTPAVLEIRGDEVRELR